MIETHAKITSWHIPPRDIVTFENWCKTAILSESEKATIELARQTRRAEDEHYIALGYLVSVEYGNIDGTIRRWASTEARATALTSIPRTSWTSPEQTNLYARWLQETNQEQLVETYPV